MAGLSEKTCVPCRGGVPPLTAEQIKPLAAEVLVRDGKANLVRTRQTFDDIIRGETIPQI